MADYKPLSEHDMAGILSDPLNVFPVYNDNVILRALAALNPKVDTSRYSVKGPLSETALAELGAASHDFPETKAEAKREWVQTHVPYMRIAAIEPSLNPKHNLYASGKSWLDNKIVGMPVAVTPKLARFILSQYEVFVAKMAAVNCAPGPSAAYCFAYLIARLVVAYPMLLDRVNGKGHFDAIDSVSRHMVSAVHKGLTQAGYQWNPQFNPPGLASHVEFPFNLNHARSISRFLHVDPDQSHDTQFIYRKQQVMEGYGLGSDQAEKRFHNLVHWTYIDGPRKNKKAYQWDLVREVLREMGLMEVRTEADYARSKTFTFEPGKKLAQFIDSYLENVDKLIYRRLQGRPSYVRPLAKWLSNLKGSNRILPNAVYAFSERGTAIVVFSPQLPAADLLVKHGNLTNQPKKILTYHGLQVPMKANTMLRRAAMVNVCSTPIPQYKEVADNINLPGRPALPTKVKDYIRMLNSRPVNLPVNKLLDALSQLHHTTGEAITSGAFRILSRMLNPENLGCQQVSGDRHNQIVRHRAYHFTTLRSPRINTPLGMGSLPSQLKQVILEHSGYFNYDIQSCHPMLTAGLIKKYKRDLLAYPATEGKVQLSRKVLRQALKLFKVYESKQWGRTVLNAMEEGPFSGVLDSALFMIRNPWGAGVMGNPKWSGTYTSDRLSLHQVWKSAEDCRSQKWRKERFFIDVMDGACKVVFLSVLYGSSLKTTHDSVLKSRVIPDLIDRLIKNLVAPIELSLSDSHVQALKIKMTELAFCLIQTIARVAEPIIQTMQMLPYILLSHPDFLCSAHSRLRVNLNLIAKDNYFLFKDVERALKQAGLDPKEATANAVLIKNALGSQAYFYTDTRLSSWARNKEKYKLIHYVMCGMEQAVMMEFNMRHKDLVVAQEHDGVMMNAELTPEQLAEFTSLSKQIIGVPLKLVKKNFV